MPTDPPEPVYFDPIERQIREAIERGEFENLPGAGQPIADLDRPYEAAWWAKRWVARARLQDEADELRRAVRREGPLLAVAADRQAAAARIDELNRAIAAVNEHLDESERIPPLAR